MNLILAPEKNGMAGLETQHKGGKPRTVTPAVQGKYCERRPNHPTTTALTSRTESWRTRWSAQIHGAADLESGPRRRHTSEEFLVFLADIVEQIHIILDRRAHPGCNPRLLS
jgi:hypothetical protein